MAPRWKALTIIFLSFIQFTLNWFCIVPCFGEITRDLHLTFPQIAVVVSMFIAGYGIAHIPGGWLAGRYGIRLTLLVGIAIETMGAVISARSGSYGILLAGRFVCGIGGSMYLGAAVGLTTAWFQKSELATANGMTTGVAFSVGAAIGLFAWGPIVTLLGWRDALLAGGGIGFATLIFTAILFPVPPGGKDILFARHFGIESLRRVFGNSILWLMGFAILGSYGSFFSASQLLPHFVQSHFNVGPGVAENISVSLLISAIPGSFIGGWLSDRLLGTIPTFIGSCAMQALALALIPFLDLTGVEIAAVAIGAASTMAFVGWVSVPGRQKDALRLSDIPTAVGLMLTIAALGGAFIPPLFGTMVTTVGSRLAWGFEGAICLLFALLALIPISAPTVLHTKPTLDA